MGGRTFERESTLCNNFILKRGWVYFRGWAYFREITVIIGVANWRMLQCIIVHGIGDDEQLQSKQINHMHCYKRDDVYIALKL